MLHGYSSKLATEATGIIMSNWDVVKRYFKTAQHVEMPVLKWCTIPEQMEKKNQWSNWTRQDLLEKDHENGVHVRVDS